MSLNLAARPRRGLRWVVLFSVPALLLVSLLVTMRTSPGVDAASANTFVDCSGGSQTPNFDTIQEAVSNTAQSGVVHICTGVYSESVNLALMNGGGGDGFEGDITVIAEDGPGTVQIAPLVGPALYISIALFAGDITLEGLDVTSGNSTGINFADLDKMVSGTATLSSVVAHNAGGGNPGVKISALTGIQIINSQAISNDGAGFELRSDGVIRVDGSVAQFNGQNLLSPFAEGTGFHLVDNFPFAGCLNPLLRFEIVNSTASDNIGYGIRADSIAHDIFVDGVNAHRNLFDGIDAASPSTICPVNIVVNNSAADDNGIPGSAYNGICMYAPIGLASAENSSSQNNYAAGIAAWSGCRRFSAAPEPGAAALDVSAPDGAVVLASPQVVITNSSGISNATDGFLFDYANFITVTNISALRNAEQGVNFIFVSQSLDSSIPLDTSFTKIVDSLIVENQAYGVHYDVPGRIIVCGPGPAACAPADIASATQFVNNSIICNNVQGGVVITNTFPNQEGAPAAPDLVAGGALEVDATANWWGDNSGPAHPTNPSGSGNGVFDSSNGFTGTVYFNPFIDQIAGAASPNPTLSGIPVNVNFQFSGAAATVFLGQGVGNLNDTPPFTVSTNNGALTGNNPAAPAVSPAAVGPSIEQFIGPANGNLPVLLAPASAGQALVTLQGPCNLNVEVPVLVATPSIVITKTPDLQTIPEGATAPFSITVHNTGDITLTNVTVTDALAADCDNALGVLGPGVSTVYACEVTPAASFTNVAVVEGTPQIATKEPLQPVTDSDDAVVIVETPFASIVITKTPDLQTIPEGATAPFSITVHNTGDVTLTNVTVTDALASDCDNALGDLAPNASTVYACEVTPAASFTNVAVVEGTPLIDTEQPLQPVTDSDDAQVIVAPLSISLVKTVGAAGSTPSCPAPGTITVEQGAVVEYCYTVTNTGDFTLSTHSLVDDKLGVLMTGQPFELAPGASVSTLDLGLVITTSLQVTTSNVATWTAGVDPLVSTTTSSVTASNAATVNVPPAPTAIDPDDQPLLPRRIFVPNLSR